MITQREQMFRADGFISTEALKHEKLRMFKISKANAMAAERTWENETRCRQNGDQHQTTQGPEGHDEPRTCSFYVMGNVWRILNRELTLKVTF